VTLRGTGKLGPDVTGGPSRVVGGPNGCVRGTGDRVSKKGAGGGFGARNRCWRACCRAVVLSLPLAVTVNICWRRR